MAEEGTENGMTPDFDETDSKPEKSNISLLRGGSAAPIQVKATIDNFYKLITNHYGNRLRLNEMTGKPEFWK